MQAASKLPQDRASIHTGPGKNSTWQRRLTLLAMCIAQGMILLDVTIVNIALPSIQRELHASSGELELGHQRLCPQPGRLDSAQRQPRRPLRAQTLLCGRHGRVRAWIGRVRAVRICFGAHRRAGASGVGGAIMSALALSILSETFSERPGRRDRNLGDRGRSRLRPGPSRRRPPARGVRMVVHLLGQRAVRPRRHRPDRHRGARITKSRYPPGGRSRRPHQRRGPARPDLRPHRVGLELLDVGPGRHRSPRAWCCWLHSCSGNTGHRSR